MTERDIEMWLHTWCDDHLQEAMYRHSVADMASEANQCMADARMAGISPAKLVRAAAGDLLGFLFDWQTEFTDARIKRKTGNGRFEQ